MAYYSTMRFHCWCFQQLQCSVHKIKYEDKADTWHKKKNSPPPHSPQIQHGGNKHPKKLPKPSLFSYRVIIFLALPHRERIHQLCGACGDRATDTALRHQLECRGDVRLFVLFAGANVRTGEFSFLTPEHENQKFFSPHVTHRGAQWSFVATNWGDQRKTIATLHDNKANCIPVPERMKPLLVVDLVVP